LNSERNKTDRKMMRSGVLLILVGVVQASRSLLVLARVAKTVPGRQPAKLSAFLSTWAHARDGFVGNEHRIIAPDAKHPALYRSRQLQEALRNAGRNGDGAAFQQAMQQFQKEPDAFVEPVQSKKAASLAVGGEDGEDSEDVDYDLAACIEYTNTRSVGTEKSLDTNHCDLGNDIDLEIRPKLVPAPAQAPAEEASSSAKVGNGGVADVLDRWKDRVKDVDDIWAGIPDYDMDSQPASNE
jgi:hypothetical protein